MSQETTRRLAIMFTDLVGYSSMMGADEHQAIEQLHEYRTILCSVIESHEGTVIEFAGDAIFARFENTTAAVNAGLEIQQSLTRYNKNHEKGLHTRIGIHVGDVVEKEGSIYGDDINIAARLEPICDPRGVCISEAVYSELDVSLKDKCISFGRPLLKNIGDSLEVFNLFPGPITRQKRLQLELKRVRRYLSDHSAVSVPLTFALLVVGIILIVPAFIKPTADVHNVELGEISNLSPQGLPAYYTIGIADEIHTRLKLIPNLYISSIEDDIGGEAILTGSIEKTGDTVRLSYVIKDRKSGTEIGGASIEGKLEDMLVLQGRLADNVARDLTSEFNLRPVPAKPAKHQANPEAYQYYLQAREYVKRPDDPQTLENAISLYQKALQVDDEYAAAFAGLCEAYWGMYLLVRQNDLVDKAVEACLMAETLDAELTEVQVALGEIYKGRGKLSESIDAYNNAIQIEPRNISAYVGLAELYTTLDNHDLAEQTYQRALGLQPGNWEAWQTYGNYQFNTGQFNKAEKSFRKVIALTPDNVNAYSGLGAVLLYQGDFKQAARVFDEQAKFRPSATMLSNAATMYYFDGDFKRAAGMYEKAIELEPEQCLYWVNLTYALHQIKSRQVEAKKTDSQALSICDRELEINPGNRQVLLMKSRLLAQMGRNDEAMAIANTIAPVNSSDPDTQLNLSLIYLQCDELELAQSALEEALKQGYPKFLVQAEPGFAPVRHEQWFRSLLGGDHQ